MSVGEIEGETYMHIETHRKIKKYGKHSSKKVVVEIAQSALSISRYI